MNALFADIKKIILENRNILAAGAAVTLLLTLYFILWHVTIITFGSFYSILDVSGSFLIRSVSYLVASAVIASVVSILMVMASRPLMKKIIIGIVLVVFAGSEIVRMVDWGALYFGGAHIDSNFWVHAFYTD